MTVAIRQKSGLDLGWTEQGLRELLIRELASILAIDCAAIDPSRNFDEYGLDSTDAVVVVGLVEERLGIDLPPELLLQNRTIDEVIRSLLSARQPVVAAESVVDENLLFLIPGAGGRDDTGLIRFRAQCAPTLNFELIRLGDWREWVERDLAFEDLVARAVDQIQAHSPDGPLRLLGYSQGGQLAYAVAQSLVQAGRSVRFLGLLDTQFGPGMMRQADKVSKAAPITSILRGVQDRATKAARYIREDLFETDGVRRPGKVRMLAFTLWRRSPRLSRSRRMLRLVARHGKVLFRGAGGVRLDIAFQICVFFSLWQAWCHETVRRNPLRLPAFLFRSGEPGEPDHGWGECFADLKIISISGDHDTLFGPENLEHLAARFTTIVQDATSPKTNLVSV